MADDQGVPRFNTEPAEASMDEDLAGVPVFEELLQNQEWPKQSEAMDETPTEPQPNLFAFPEGDDDADARALEALVVPEEKSMFPIDNTASQPLVMSATEEPDTETVTLTHEVVANANELEVLATQLSTSSQPVERKERVEDMMQDGVPETRPDEDRERDALDVRVVQALGADALRTYQEDVAKFSADQPNVISFGWQSMFMDELLLDPSPRDTQLHRTVVQNVVKVVMSYIVRIVYGRFDVQSNPQAGLENYATDEMGKWVVDLSVRPTNHTAKEEAFCHNVSLHIHEILRAMVAEYESGNDDPNRGGVGEQAMDLALYADTNITIGGGVPPLPSFDPSTTSTYCMILRQRFCIRFLEILASAGIFGPNLQRAWFHFQASDTSVVDYATTLLQSRPAATGDVVEPYVSTIRRLMQQLEDAKVQLQEAQLTASRLRRELTDTQASSRDAERMRQKEEATRAIAIRKVSTTKKEMWEGAAELAVAFSFGNMRARKQLLEYFAGICLPSKPKVPLAALKRNVREHLRLIQSDFQKQMNEAKRKAVQKAKPLLLAEMDKLWKTKKSEWEAAASRILNSEQKKALEAERVLQELRAQTQQRLPQPAQLRLEAPKFTYEDAATLFVKHPFEVAVLMTPPNEALLEEWDAVGGLFNTTQFFSAIRTFYSRKCTAQVNQTQEEWKRYSETQYQEGYNKRRQDEILQPVTTPQPAIVYPVASLNRPEDMQVALQTTRAQNQVLMAHQQQAAMAVENNRPLYIYTIMVCRMVKKLEETWIGGSRMGAPGEADADLVSSMEQPLPVEGSDLMVSFGGDRSSFYDDIVSVIKEALGEHMKHLPDGRLLGSRTLTIISVIAEAYGVEADTAASLRAFMTELKRAFDAPHASTAALQTKMDQIMGNHDEFLRYEGRIPEASRPSLKTYRGSMPYYMDNQTYSGNQALSAINQTFEAVDHGAELSVQVSQSHPVGFLAGKTFQDIDGMSDADLKKLAFSELRDMNPSLGKLFQTTELTKEVMIQCLRKLAFSEHCGPTMLNVNANVDTPMARMTTQLDYLVRNNRWVSYTQGFTLGYRQQYQLLLSRLSVFGLLKVVPAEDPRAQMERGLVLASDTFLATSGAQSNLDRVEWEWGERAILQLKKLRSTLNLSPVSTIPPTLSWGFALGFASSFVKALNPSRRTLTGSLTDTQIAMLRVLSQYVTRERLGDVFSEGALAQLQTELKTLESDLKNPEAQRLVSKAILNVLRGPQETKLPQLSQEVPIQALAYSPDLPHNLTFKEHSQALTFKEGKLEIPFHRAYFATSVPRNLVTNSTVGAAFDRLSYETCLRMVLIMQQKAREKRKVLTVILACATLESGDATLGRIFDATQLSRAPDGLGLVKRRLKLPPPASTLYTAAETLEIILMPMDIDSNMKAFFKTDAYSNYFPSELYFPYSRVMTVLCEDGIGYETILASQLYHAWILSKPGEFWLDVVGVSHSVSRVQGLVEPHTTQTKFNGTIHWNLTPGKVHDDSVSETATIVRNIASYDRIMAAAPDPSPGLEIAQKYRNDLVSRLMAFIQKEGIKKGLVQGAKNPSLAELEQQPMPIAYTPLPDA